MVSILVPVTEADVAGEALAVLPQILAK